PRILEEGRAAHAVHPPAAGKGGPAAPAGARGETMTARWDSFDQLLADVESGRITAAAAFSRWTRLERGQGGAAPDPDGERVRRERLAAIRAELDDLVGLAAVKSLVRELEAYVEIQRLRAAAGLAHAPLVM